MGRARRHWKGLVAGAVVLAVALAIGVPWIYIHLVEGSQPKALSLSDVPSAYAGAASRTTDAAFVGTWKVASGSTAGYRVHETLAGQSATAVGRTSAVTGSFTIQKTELTTASFTVQMATVTSDRAQRDQQFTGGSWTRRSTRREPSS